VGCLHRFLRISVRDAQRAESLQQSDRGSRDGEEDARAVVPCGVEFYLLDGREADGEQEEAVGRVKVPHAWVLEVFNPRDLLGSNLVEYGYLDC